MIRRCGQTANSECLVRVEGLRGVVAPVLAPQRRALFVAPPACGSDRTIRADPIPSRRLRERLGRFVRLSIGEEAALDGLAGRRRAFKAEEVLLHEDRKPEYVCLILSGMAYRFKFLPNGQRQILGYLIAGELCDVEFAEGSRPDHTVAALSDAQVALVSLETIAEIQAAYPKIRLAFFLAAMVERAILRQWLVNVGQRSALQRVSHFLCELSTRLRELERSQRNEPIHLPVSQAVLADTTGMTTVHLNRTLKSLRGDGLIALRRNRLSILEPERLAEVADFDENYLLQERYCL